MRSAIVAIVEGHSEVASVPVLLRRIFNELGAHDIQAGHPFRVNRKRVVKNGEIERAVTQALRARQNVGAFLVILDADEDCPARLGPSLLARCRNASSLPVAVVLAKREFEAWFLGTKESLRGVRAIREDAVAPDDPESIRGAKEHLSDNMRRLGHLKMDDHPALAAHMDFDLTRQRCPSFDKFLRDVRGLVEQIREQAPGTTA